MTHNDLVKIAEQWIRKQRGFHVVLRDVQTWATREQPDVIAWKNSGASTLLECKASRSDFLADAKKGFRIRPTEGMGFHRYYCISKPFIVEEELPSGWGLLLAPNGLNKKLVVVKKSAPFTKRNESAERALLINVVRRVTEGWGRQMLGDNAPLGPNGDAHPKPARIIRELQAENRELRRRLNTKTPTMIYSPYPQDDGGLE